MEERIEYDIFEIIRIQVGKLGLTINVCGTSFFPNWRETKDLHPKAYMIESIFDYIEDLKSKSKINYKKKHYKKGTYTLTVPPSDYINDSYVEFGENFMSGAQLVLPLNDKLKEISKLKKDWRLFNILVSDYINSLEGFEFFIDKIYNDEVLLQYREKQNICINN